MNRKISALLLILCCCASTEAFARSVRSRELKVIIQTIDRQAHTLTLTGEHGREPRPLAWHADTQFLLDGKSVSAAELRADVSATVYYRTPFFGKPFLTKVVWFSRLGY